MFRAYGTVCWICGHEGAYEVDHLTRRADGGAVFDLANLRPAHGSNAPCPVCISPSTGKPACCNQSRNRRPRAAKVALSVDPQDL